MDEAMLKSGQFPNVAIMAGSDPTEVMREYANDDSHDALKEQINRFSASKSEENAENDTSNGDINNFDVQNDTREKLEADLNSLCLDCLGLGWNAANDLKKAIRKLLDRQDAITSRECEERLDFKAITEVANIMNAELTAERDEFKAKWEECLGGMSGMEMTIDNLTAERDALKEQINRFNVPKSEENAENDTSKGVLNNFDVQNDSREKLEADAETLLFEFGHYCATSREGLSDDVYVFIGDLTDLLDRQVAITAASFDCNACADDVLQRESALCAKVDELTADLDACKLREKAADDYDFREAAQRWEQAFEDKCGEVVRLTAERDQLSRDLTAEHALVVQFEHDNEEIKADLKTANDTINTLRASVAGLKETVEKLGARNE